jgi:serine protease AprX
MKRQPRRRTRGPQPQLNPAEAGRQIREEDWLYELLYPRREHRGRRFTQDTPILADVWLALAELSDSKGRVDVLLNPHNKVGVGGVLRAIHARLSKSENRIAYNESHVVVKVDLEEILTVLLPQSSWWQGVVRRGNAKEAEILLGRLASSPQLTFDSWRKYTEEHGRPAHPTDSDLIQLVQIAAAVLLSRNKGQPSDNTRELAGAVDLVRRSLLQALRNVPEEPTIWTVSTNRLATLSLWRSRETIKADAAILVFNIACDQICWAVIDSGVDATHPAFKRRDGTGDAMSRVVKTYDFTRLRSLLSTPASGSALAEPWLIHLDAQERRNIASTLRERLQLGLQIDWDRIAPVLEVPHVFEKAKHPTPAKKHQKSKAAARYEIPVSEHGTHVAGIIGADWRGASVDTSKVVVKDIYDLMNLQQLNASQILRGICPDIQLYDLRVFDSRTGAGDEFAMLAALQFVRHLNSSKSKRVIHGVNISASLEHDVRSYACGRTPICDECERAVASGLVVVAAAGNTGFDEHEGAFSSTYRQSSITDPGNSDSVITVGATHREMPHTYGVSYFSSRGPTGDGRAKPDLVAPGERIFSAVPRHLAATLDGTSMAAPHVSGAAALLMARHIELIGQPSRIKKILCGTATDLGRVPQYQGSGLLDILRALESV